MLAFNADVYNALKFIHVVAAVAWVGSGLFVQYRGTRLRHTGTPEQTANLAREVADSTPWFMASSGVVLLAGISLVLYAPGLDFTDTWILLGLARVRVHVPDRLPADPSHRREAGGRRRQRRSDVAGGPSAHRPDLRHLTRRSGRVAAGDPGHGVQARGVADQDGSTLGSSTAPPNIFGWSGRAPERSDDHGAGGALVRFASASSTAS